MVGGGMKERGVRRIFLYTLPHSSLWIYPVKRTRRKHMYYLKYSTKLSVKLTFCDSLNDNTFKGLGSRLGAYSVHQLLSLPLNLYKKIARIHVCGAPSSLNIR